MKHVQTIVAALFCFFPATSSKAGLLDGRGAPHFGSLIERARVVCSQRRQGNTVNTITCPDHYLCVGDTRCEAGQLLSSKIKVCNDTARPKEERLGACTEAIRLSDKSYESSAARFEERGEIYWKDGKVDQALADFREAVRIAPKAGAVEDNWKGCRGSDPNPGISACMRLSGNPNLSRRERADAFVELGLFLIDKSATLAFGAYDNAIQADPKFARSYLKKGQAYISQKEYTKALPDLTRAIELEPNNFEPYQRRAYCYHQLKKYELAVADFDKSVALKPSVWAYIERGDALADKQEPGNAAGSYKTAAGLDADADALMAIIRRLIKIGRIEDASYVIARLDDDDEMMKLRLLRDYEPLWASTSAVAAMSESDRLTRAVANAEKEASKDPSNLALKRAVVTSYHDAARDVEAEQLAYETLATLATKNNEKQTLFLRGVLSEVLISQGKFDRASTVMDPVLSEVKSGRFDNDPISPLLNYSVDLMGAGKFREAFDAAKLAEAHVSSYGRSVMRKVLSCSAAQLGRKPEAEAIAASMLREMDADSSEVRLTIQALLCTGQVDKAAAIFITGVQKYHGRMAWLAKCESQTTTLPFSRELKRLQQELLERDDVRNAVTPFARQKPNC